jgi:DNA mismatch repair protein MutS2
LGLSSELVGDARSRLGRAEAEFEQTLASIKQAQQTAEEFLARAAEAEERARAARHEAEEERTRARLDRDTAAAQAREEAQRALAEVQAEIRSARELLARASLTEARLEDSAQALDERLSSLSDDGATPLPEPVVEEVPAITVGAAVRSRDGWQGTVAEIDSENGEATIAAGPLRVRIPLGDLEIVAAAPSSIPGETIRPQAHRFIPTSLDLRGARVEEALDSLDQYLNDAALAEASKVTIIHGHGSGALRDALRAQLRDHPLVKSWRPGERGEGGDGATIVEL